jgi:hypothetical protein
MSKITSLMTSLHDGHKAEERIKCIDNMLFNKCEDTKHTILQAFWWYRKHSTPLDKVEQAREEIQKLRGCSCSCSDGIIDDVDDILDNLIESEKQK